MDSTVWRKTTGQRNSLGVVRKDSGAHGVGTIISPAALRGYPGIHCNAQTSRQLPQRFAHLGLSESAQLAKAMKRTDLSARTYVRFLLVEG